MNKIEKQTIIVVLIVILVPLISFYLINGVLSEKYLSQQKIHDIFSHLFKKNNGQIEKNFNLVYDSKEWNITAVIPEIEYLEAKNKTRSVIIQRNFITENQASIKDIAWQLSYILENEDNKCKECIVKEFMKNIHYERDIMLGMDDYPKYPVETILEEKGDCEDLSYLAASILKAMDVKVSLLLMDKHMAVGLQCSNCIYPLIQVNNSRGIDTKIVYFETMVPDIEIGKIPDWANTTGIRFIEIK